WHAKAPHISDKLIELAEEHARAQWELEKMRELHSQRMDLRRWWAQMAMLLMGLCNVVVLALVAWHYADTGNVVPGLTIFGAGAGLTAGAFGAGHALSRRTPTSGARAR
ncbi:MAG TPA: hypothetical protein VF821_08910, partial [Lentzea sp.]